MISSLKVALCSTVCLSLLLPSSGFANWIINLNDDNHVSIGGTGAVTGTGSAITGSGDLRFVLNQIINDQAQFSTPVTQTITFDPSVTSVTLTNLPPPINLFRDDTITITGSQTIIDGGGYRPFYLTQGTVNLVSLAITNSSGIGGSGTSGGGGGMGAGGAIFIDYANVTLTDVSFTNCGATSGQGGVTGSGYGGGGGLGGAGGGASSPTSIGFAGGGGYSGAGGNSTNPDPSTGRDDCGGPGGGGIGDGGDGTRIPNPSGTYGTGGGGGAIIGAIGGSNGSIGVSVGSYVFGGGGGGGFFINGTGGGTNPNTSPASGNGGGGGYNPTPADSSQGGSGGGGGGGGGTLVAGNGGVGGGGGGGVAGFGGGGGGYLGGGGAGGIATGSFTGSSSGGFGGGGGSAYDANFGGIGGFGGGGGAHYGTPGKGGFGGGGGGGGASLSGSGGVGATEGSLDSGGYGAALGGAIFINGTGIITFGSNVSTDSSNTLKNLGSAAAAGSDLFAVSGATLIFAPIQDTKVTFAGSIADDSPFSLPGGSYTAGTGAGSSIIMQGTGTVVLSGSNTYSGTTTISSGTISISSDNNLGNPAALLSMGGGSLQTTASFSSARDITLSGSGGTFVPTGSLTLTGTISGVGPLALSGSGTLVLTASNTYTGTTTISAGVLQLSGTGSINTSPLTLAGTGTFDISPLTNGGAIITDLSGVSAGSMVILGTNTLTIDTTSTTSYAGLITGSSGGGGITKQGSGTLTLAGTISGSGSLTQTDSGTLVLTASNGYTGATTVSGGVLQLSGAGAISNTPLTVTSTGTFDISPLSNGGTTITALSGASTSSILLGTNTLTLDTSNTGTYAGIITGSSGGGITKQGSGTLTLTGTISGSGSLTQSSSGTLILTGTNTYTGATTISAGFLAVNGSILSTVAVNAGGTLKGSGTINAPIVVTGGTISPGNSIGTLTGSSVSFDSFSIFNVEISPTDASQLILTGTATIASGATVLVTHDAGTYPSANSYPILSAAEGITGSFNPTVAGGLPGYYFRLLQTPNLITLQYSTGIPLLGLQGNALKIAKYLNEYAPQTLQYFDNLSGSALNNALTSASPSRNGIPVSVTQQTAFTFSGIVSSHLDTFRMAKRGFAKKNSVKKTAYKEEKLRYDIYDNKGESSYYIDSDAAENEPELKLKSSSKTSSDKEEKLRYDIYDDKGESSYYIDSGVAEDLEKKTYYLDKDAPEYYEVAAGFDISALLVDASDQMLPTPYTKEVSVYKENDFCGWISGLAQYAHQKAEEQNPSYNFLSEVLTTGFDYRGIEKTLLGGGLGYAHTNYSEGESAGHGNINYYFSTLYANAYIDQFYISPALLGVYNQVHNTRNISFTGFSSKAKATINSWQFTPHLEVGYDIQEDKWGNITPFTALDWVINWQQAYNEEGAAPFTARQGSKRTSMARSETGFKFSQAFSYSWGALLLKEKGSYVFEKPFGTSNLHTGFVGLPSALALVTGTSPLNLGAVGFDLQASVGEKKPISIKMGLEGEMGVRYWSGEVNLMLSKDF